jgi:probable rRNA maturation factor
MRRIRLDLQNPAGAVGLPKRGDLQRWCEAAIGSREGRCKLVIRIVDEGEGASLNRRYRHQWGPTNVLSFPWEGPSGKKWHFLGDLVICEPVVCREAGAQGKAARAHWAHLVVHGVLHLLGFDHGSEGEALVMEALEQQILADLGFSDPYV